MEYIAQVQAKQEPLRAAFGSPKFRPVDWALPGAHPALQHERYECFARLPDRLLTRPRRRDFGAIGSLMCLRGVQFWPPIAVAQTSSAQTSSIEVVGTIRNASGEPVADALVFLEEKGGARLVRTKSNPDGSFVFSLKKAGTYNLRAEKDGLRSAATRLLALRSGDQQRCDVVLAQTSTNAADPTASRGSDSASANTSGTKSASTSATMELADEPTFTVAGVTDWSNAGLHGSDTRGRTSDALAKETLALKSGDGDKTPSSSPNASYKLALEYRAQGDFARARDEAQKSLAIADTGTGHRLLGDLDERIGDPVAAVREFERAAQIDERAELSRLGGRIASPQGSATRGAGFHERVELAPRLREIARRTRCRPLCRRFVRRGGSTSVRSFGPKSL